MDRTGLGTLIAGVGVEAVGMTLFVMWSNPPLVVPALILAIGVVLMLIGVWLVWGPKGKGVTSCPKMRVETVGFEGYPLHPNGYGWLIPSATIANLSGQRIKVDASLVMGERRLAAARAAEAVETQAHPPRNREPRLSVPADVPPQDTVHGSLVFVMSAAAYNNLPPGAMLSRVPKVLEVRDLLSESVERHPMPPENQTIIVPPIVLPQPNFYHKVRRGVKAAWKRLTD
jgi:hypothetical protein